MPWFLKGDYAPDRRDRMGRRSGVERRQVPSRDDERRTQNMWIAAERRSGQERRDSDRRALTDRRLVPDRRRAA